MATHTVNVASCLLRWPLAAMTCGLVMACSPALDWREVRPPDGAWTALFPCRPVEQVRALSLAEQSVSWRLLVCQAAEMTVAMGDADVGDPGQVGWALRALRGAAAQRVGAQAVQSRPLRWPGMTPQPDAGHWQLQGRDAEGKAMQVELWLVSHGTRVVQAMLIGPMLPEASVQTFSEGLAFPP